MVQNFIMVIKRLKVLFMMKIKPQKMEEYLTGFASCTTEIKKKKKIQSKARNMIGEKKKILETTLK